MVSNPYSGIGTAVVFAAMGGPIHWNIIQITTLYNVCSVHRGMFSTLGGYHEYIGGIPWVHRGDIMSTSGGYYEYIGGCSVHWRATLSTLGDVQYIRGIPWVHWGISWVHRGISWYMWGDTMSTLGGYHEYIGFSIEIERILSSCSPTCIMISLQFTEHPPMYSWYPPNVLMVSPRYTHGIPPHLSWYPPDALNVPDVLMISPRCTEHPLMYWTHIMQDNYVIYCSDYCLNKIGWTNGWCLPPHFHSKKNVWNISIHIPRVITSRSPPKASKLNQIFALIHSVWKASGCRA